MTLAVRLAPARTTTQFRETVLTHTTRARDLDVDLAGAFATALAGVFTAAFDGGAFFAASFVAGFLRGATGARASVRAEVPAGAGAAEWSTERGDPRTGGSAGGEAGIDSATAGSRTGSATGVGSICGGALSTGTRTVVAGCDGLAGASMAATTLARGSCSESSGSETTAVVSDRNAESATGVAPGIAFSRDPADTTESVDADESGLRMALILAAETSAGGSLCTSHAPQAIATNATTPAPFQTYGPIGARAGCVPHQRHAPSFAG